MWIILRRKSEERLEKNTALAVLVVTSCCMLSEGRCVPLIHPSSILLHGVVWSVCVRVVGGGEDVVRLGGGRGGLSKRRRSSACGWLGPTNTNDTTNNDGFCRSRAL